MSSSYSSIGEINTINNINNTIYQLWTYIIIFFGTAGHLLNIYVFTRSILYSNPCGRYFLAATISGLFVASVNVPMRLVQAMYPAYNPFGYSTASCKSLTFLMACIKAYPSWFIVLASIDRFLCSSSSTAVRRWSSTSIANRTIPFVIIIIGLFYLYIPIVFENIQTNIKCPYAQTTYPLFNGIWNLLIFSLGPSITMLVFGLLSIRHIRQSVKRIVPQQIQSELILPSHDQTRRQRKTDRQLIQMMLFQCFYFNLMTTPYSVFGIYSALRMHMTVDALQMAKDSMFSHISGLASSTCPCTTFYCFTLSSQLFRHQLKQLFRCGKPLQQ